MRRTFEHDPEAVTKARTDAGLTKTALAKELGCSLSLVSEIESGTRNARLPLLERMAELLGCETSELRHKDADGQATPPTAGALPKMRDAQRPTGEAVGVSEPKLRKLTGGE
jgi:transcriptional regulator with XRE-family HTH domain